MTASSTDGLALLGNNHVELNEATVKAALEFYFAAVFKNPPTVRSVSASSPNASLCLRVTLAAPEREQEPNV